MSEEFDLDSEDELIIDAPPQNKIEGSKFLVKASDAGSKFPTLSGKTKIERYGLEELVLESAITKQFSVNHIVKICNASLQEKGSDKKVTPSNVHNYLKTLGHKLAMLKQDYYENMITKVGVIDTLTSIQQAVVSGFERKQIIKEQLDLAIENDDKRSLVQHLQLDQSNDGAIVNAAQTMANLQNKLQTCFTSDYVKSLINKMLSVVMSFEGVDPLAKEHLIVEMSKVIEDVQ